MNHLGTKNLESERLLLRKFKENDAKEIFEGFINQDNFLYYSNRRKITLEDEIKSLKGIDEKYNNNEYYNWLITLKSTGKIIGSIYLRVNNYNESVEFNYAIDDKYSGNGYMTEVLDTIKKYCIDELKVNRFSGGCEINNHASKRVMEKCSLKNEGILRNYLKLNDGYHDMYLYSFIRERD